MATVRVYDYEFGNYNEAVTPNTLDLNVLFQAPLSKYDDINISYNDGLMLTLTLNVEDDLIEKINYLTIDKGYYPAEDKFVFLAQGVPGQYTTKFNTHNNNITTKEGFMTLISTEVDTSFFVDGDIIAVENTNLGITFYATWRELSEGYEEIRPYFVLGYQYIMKDQYALSCKLDTVLYKLADIKEAEAMVERGFIDDDNKLIYNNEGIEVTQIKKNELPIGEKVTQLNNSIIADIGWYAVYMDDKIGTTDELKIRQTGGVESAVASYNSFNDTPFREYINNPATVGHITNYKTYLRTYDKEPQEAISGGLDAFIIRSRFLGVNSYRELIQIDKTKSKKIKPTFNTSFSNLSDTDLGRISGATIGGLQYKNIDGLEQIPYQAFYDLREGRYYRDLVAWGTVWGGSDVAGGIGIRSGYLDVIEESIRNLMTTDVSNVQASESPISNQLTVAQLLNWNDKVINIGTPGNQIAYKVEVEIVNRSGISRANSPKEMLRNIYEMKDINDQDWEPSLDSSSVAIINYKNTQNLTWWNSDSDFAWMDSALKDALTDTSKKYNYETVHYEIDTTTFIVKVNKLIEDNEIIKLGASNPNSLAPTLQDQPYKVLLFPFGKLILKDYAPSDDYGPYVTWQDEKLVLNVINNLITDYGGGNNPRIYDVQRLPYAPILWSRYTDYINPVTNTVYVTGNNNQTDIIEDEKYLLKAGDFTPKLLMFVPVNSRKEFEIEIEGTLPEIDRKVDSIVNTAQISSNTYKTYYNYQFTKNDYVNKFKVTVDLKPIAPYFNIDPIGSEDGLMPGNYGDGRGVNIAEDFSATQVTDAFNVYKRENMNYLNSFNSQQDYERQLFEKESANAIARMNLSNKQAYTSLLTSSTQTLASGGAAVGAGVAMTQAKTQPLLAQTSNTQVVNTFNLQRAQANLSSIALAGGLGALAGTALSAGVGAAGIAISNAQAKETLSLQQAQGRDMLGLQQAQVKEQLNYTLQNISSLPSRLDKVSGVNALAKNTARLALYDTTTEERARVEEYFDLNGYTLNTYDTLKPYIDFDREFTYVKGSIYKFNKPINSAMLQDINTRLAVGIRFRKVGEE